MDSFVADTIFIDAPASTVHAALLDPDHVLVWMDAEHVEIAAEVGGVFRARRADGSTVGGTIAAIDQDRRLGIAAYHWQRAGERRGPMSVEFVLEEADGGVWLNVRQNDLDSHDGWKDFALATRREWVSATVALKRHVEGI